MSSPFDNEKVEMRRKRRKLEDNNNNNNNKMRKSERSASSAHHLRLPTLSSPTLSRKKWKTKANKILPQRHFTILLLSPNKLGQLIASVTSSTHSPKTLINKKEKRGRKIHKRITRGNQSKDQNHFSVPLQQASPA